MEMEREKGDIHVKRGGRGRVTWKEREERGSYTWKESRESNRLGKINKKRKRESEREKE
jgi:hypothetical protein